jgi:hypothetical protein
MHKQNDSLTHARQLRADILGSPTVWLPRRDVLLDWLNAFLLRAGRSASALEESDQPDLAALDQFLRIRKIPIAG